MSFLADFAIPRPNEAVSGPYLMQGRRHEGHQEALGLPLGELAESPGMSMSCAIGWAAIPVHPATQVQDAEPA